MKKKNVIIIGIIALILAVSVGYALFSDTLNINGTATAKGDFSMSATCTPGLIDERFMDANTMNRAPSLDNNYGSDSCQVNDNKITYSAELLQPGAVRNFTIKITNTGSIAATLNEENGIKESVQSCVGNYDTGEFSECIEGSQASNGLNRGVIVGFETNDGTMIVATSDNVDQILQFFDEKGQTVILEPGESVYVVVSSEWNNLGDTIEGNNKVLYKEISTMEFTFTQQTNN